MTRYLAPLALALAIGIGGCSAPPAAEPAAAAPDTSAIRAAIEASEKAWSAAYQKGDAVAVAELYTEDAASIEASGEWSRGREAIARQTQMQLDSVNVETREDVPEEITFMGDYAVEVGRFAWTGTAKNGGAPRGSSGRYMVVWRKDADGTWRIFRDIGNEAMPVKK